MILQNEILFTGGTGLLGASFKKKLPNMKYPTSDEFDITHFDTMRQYLTKCTIDTIVHAAAFTSPPLIEKNPLRALTVNIIGTANIVSLCIQRSLRLIYISTDYVFNGQHGMYKEEDPISPVNRYAWSKLGGECAVRMHDSSLIIRTSFGPKPFPYDGAFTDQWTSRETVDEIVQKIIPLIFANITGVVHVGGSRKTVYEYAKSIDPNRPIKKLSVSDMGFNIPKDTSLNTQKYKKMIDDGV